MYGIIYKATGPTGKVYIGQTIQTLKHRKSEHAYRAKVRDKRTAFQIAILELGSVNAFQWDEIDNAETAEELSAKEKYWTAFYKADDPAYGYNMQSGGIGANHSAESRQKMSEVQSGENNGFFGKHHTPEACKKIGETQKGNKKRLGKKASEETCRKLSEAHNGKKNNFCGKHHSPEARQKMSEAKKGNTIWLGRRHTEEARRKMSEAKKAICKTKRAEKR